jgi:fatty-acyl-CoA synthase
MGRPGTLTDSDDNLAAIRAAGRLTVYELFAEHAQRQPGKTALKDKSRSHSYGETLHRVDALACRLEDAGVQAGDRVAVLSENCIEYIELHLAAARIGAIIACQNWRLRRAELEHCVGLVTPALLVYSPRFAETGTALAEQFGIAARALGEPYEAWIEAPARALPPPAQDIEAGLLILYTSGTTGPAKAALISQRAIIARMTLLQMDLEVEPEDGFLAWSPMFHMGGTEHSISTLAMGGTVYVADGFDVDFIVETIGTARLGWLILVPATIERLLEALDAAGTEPVGIKRVGAMADLLPKAQIAAVSQRLRAPFLNTFGATETGIAPASRGVIPPGVVPTSLSKSLNSLCALRLVDAEGQEVADGNPGEAMVKGPTLFSGYWNNPETNARDFAGGWFRMGDLFTRNEDGTVDFVGRAKYLIKSGGENIYPAEIEGVLLSDSRVRDAIVVSAPDEKWGEVPVAVLASDVADGEKLAGELISRCREELAGYKVPKALHFIDFDELPRSSSGKIVREDVERWLAERSS